MPKKILGLLLLGLLLRLFFSYFQYSGDVNNHLAWAIGFLNSPIGFFSHHFPGYNDPNYPPLAIYFFALSRLFYNSMLAISQSLNSSISVFPSSLIPFLLFQNTQIAFLKLSPILADIGISALIYQLTLNNRRKVLMMSLYLFNPAVIYLSAVWGQIESLPIFFMLLSLFLFRKISNPFNLYLSQLSFLLAILSKQTALWLLPIFLIFWLKNSKLSDFFKSIFVCLLIFMISFRPFLSSDSNLLSPFLIYLSTLSGSTGLANEKVWNLWDLIYRGAPTLDSTILFFFSVRIWSLILVFVSLLITIFYLIKQKLTEQHLYLSLFIFSLVMFFFQTRVHEKHLAPALPFLLLLSTKRLSLILIAIISLSIFFYLNLQFALGLPFI